MQLSLNPAVSQGNGPGAGRVTSLLPLSVTLARETRPGAWRGNANAADYILVLDSKTTSVLCIFDTSKIKYYMWAVTCGCGPRASLLSTTP